jgi:hypothetical protein
MKADRPDREVCAEENSCPGPLLGLSAHFCTGKYLDVHNKVEGISTEMAVEAHKKDLAVQGKYGVNYLRYWYDEGTGKVFCLCQAPSKEAAAAVHRESHGITADEIIEVQEGS